MKTFLIFAVVAVIVVAAMIFKKKSAPAPQASESPAVSESVRVSPRESVVSSVTPTASPTSNAASSKTITVTFANGTATPNMPDIRVGDTVKFINNDNVLHWPASGPHPTHTACPGFDALRGLVKGESYSFTFNTAKTCPFHDHLKPSINGQIVVNP